MTARILALGIVGCLIMVAGPAQADEPGVMEEDIVVMVEERTRPTTATISLERWDVGLGIGGTWGSGTVNYDGKTYDIKVSGMGFIDVGFAHIVGDGDVENINDIRDVEGYYRAVSPGLAVLGGAGGAKLMNDNGVEIGLWNTELGLRVGLAPGPMWITLQ